MFTNYSIIDMINAGIKPEPPKPAIEVPEEIEISPKVLEKRERIAKKRKYYNEVKLITNSNLTEKEKSSREFRKMDIDHIVPLIYGFKNNINPELIGSRENIRLVTHKENSDKGTRITEQAKTLLLKWGYDLH